MEPVRAAFEWLRRTQSFRPKRVLIVGPGTDFAPRTALRDVPEMIYQPRLTRELAGSGVRIDCVDLNPRVAHSAAGECDSSQVLDIATGHLSVTYHVIIATNVLLYLNEKELLLACTIFARCSLRMECSSTMTGDLQSNCLVARRVCPSSISEVWP